jgi:hypothetical protein
MATAGSSNEEVAEAFKTFPFATDPEYQVSSRSRCAISPIGESLTGSTLRPLIDRSAKYPLERCLHQQIQGGEREYVEVVSRILL